MQPRQTPALTPAAFQVMVALADGPAHGYAIMQTVDDLTVGAVRIGPGTLYRTLARLAADNLVEEVRPRHRAAEPDDSRRRTYRLTRAGRRVLAQEAATLDRLIRAVTSAGLLDTPAFRRTGTKATGRGRKSA